MEAGFNFKFGKLMKNRHSEIEKKFSQFQKNGNIEEMFKYVYNLEEAQTFLKFPLTNDFKDEVISNKIREEGNVIYKKQNLKEALEKYNKCILSAPHPKLCEKNNNNDYSSLSKGYANRSAVLFQLKEYEICISDIERSLSVCNSEITQLTLNLRKTKCLLALGRYNEAEEVLKRCTTLIETHEVEEEVIKSKKNSLFKQIEQCVQGIDRGKNLKKINRYEEIINSNSSRKVNDDDIIFAYSNPTPPSLGDKPNPAIPAFSCALKLQYSSDQGRCVVATRDIKPGEVLAVETAYTSCVHTEEPNSPFSFCTNCLARCAAPLPCFECTNVVFCSEECRTKGWEKFHQKECPVYMQLLELGDGFVGPYRIIAEHSLDELKSFVSTFKNDSNKSPLEQILNENQICDSHSYRSIYFLEGNVKIMDTVRLFGLTVRAFMLTHLLMQSNRFFDNIGCEKLPNEEDIIFIGSLFIHHILAVACNINKIREAQVLSSNKNFTSDGVSVGVATFIAESFFNHSCNPSAAIFFCGNVGVCRAMQYIPTGKQVCVSYDEIYYDEPNRNTRRKNLNLAYSFICNCEACANNWNYSKEDVMSTLTLPRLRKDDKRILRNKRDKTSSLKMELLALMQRYYSMNGELEQPHCNMTNYMDFVLEIVEFFDRFVIFHPTLIQLHIFLTVIFERKSSSIIINPTKKIQSHVAANQPPELSESDINRLAKMLEVGTRDDWNSFISQ